MLKAYWWFEERRWTSSWASRLDVASWGNEVFCHEYEHHAGKLWGRDKCVAKHVSVIRRVKKSEATDGTHVRVAAIPSENGDLVRWRLGAIVSQTHKRDSISHVDCKSSKSTQSTVITRLLQTWTLLYRVSTQTWMNWFMNIHQEKLSQIVLSYCCCSKLILDQGKPHDCVAGVHA